MWVAACPESRIKDVHPSAAMIRHSMAILHKEVRSHNQLTTNYILKYLCTQFLKSIGNSRYNAEQKLDFVSVCTSYPEAAMLKVNNNINPLPVYCPHNS